MKHSLNWCCKTPTLTNLGRNIIGCFEPCSRMPPQNWIVELHNENRGKISSFKSTRSTSKNEKWSKKQKTSNWIIIIFHKTTNLTSGQRIIAMAYATSKLGAKPQLLDLQQQNSEDPIIHKTITFLGTN